jgi:hypothetical protein
VELEPRLEACVAGLVTAAIERQVKDDDGDDDDDGDGSEAFYPVYFSFGLLLTFFFNFIYFKSNYFYCYLATLFHLFNLLLSDPPLNKTSTSDIKVERKVSDVFDKPCLKPLTKYARHALLPWLTLVLQQQQQQQQQPASTQPLSSTSSSPSSPTSSSPWADRVFVAVHDVFCSHRIDELYNAIAEFPDSATSIHELRQVCRLWLVLVLVLTLMLVLLEEGKTWARASVLPPLI